MVWGFILICLPASILIFLVIVVVKLFCFYIADRTQRKKSQRRYGMFEDENGKE
jgi:preprotein translocase subunit YajC